jgi:hypothetical protein
MHVLVGAVLECLFRVFVYVTYGPLLLLEWVWPYCLGLY